MFVIIQVSFCIIHLFCHFVKTATHSNRLPMGSGEHEAQLKALV